MASILDLLQEGFRNVVPASTRTFVSTLAGNREPITEKNFTNAELAAMQDVIAQSQKRNGKSGQYKDYDKFIYSYSPEYDKQADLHNVLGRFNYTANPNKTVITDKYDFNNDSRINDVNDYEKMAWWQKPIEVVKRASEYQLTPASLVSQVANAYIGNDGREVKIEFDPQAIAKALKNK
jgi:hypothetical protein